MRHSAAAEFVAFVNVHLMILDDSAFTEAPREIIRERALQRRVGAAGIQMDELLAQFDEIEDPYLREREERREPGRRARDEGAARHPRRIAAEADARRASILVAHDLSPADVVQFKQHHFASFITDLGGTTSHTAIVARSLNIPSIVALHHARS